MTQDPTKSPAVSEREAIEMLDFAADLICDRIAGGAMTRGDKMEAWVEGKTLTVMFHDTMQFAKFRLVELRDTPSRTDMKGEPE